MAAPRSLIKPKSIKKRTQKFTQLTNMSTWSATDRSSEGLTTGCVKTQEPDPDAQHGLWDNKKIGYISLPGFWRFLMPIVKELDDLLMCCTSDCAEITHSISSRNSKSIMGKKAARLPSESLMLCNNHNEERVFCFHLRNTTETPQSGERFPDSWWVYSTG